MRAVLMLISRFTAASRTGVPSKAISISLMTPSPSGHAVSEAVAVAVAVKTGTLFVQ
jgi:hypothetical protein